ncbi:hypothetical protein GGD38_002226 [Chitinophagaceae bacterium OAS944]|nr:hypothetical protein [Chitinophagaceae bacterium OAS944]
MYCNFNAQCVDSFTVANNDVVLDARPSYTTRVDVRYVYVNVVIEN